MVGGVGRPGAPGGRGGPPRASSRRRPLPPPPPTLPHTRLPTVPLHPYCALQRARGPAEVQLGRRERQERREGGGVAAEGERRKRRNLGAYNGGARRSRDRPPRGAQGGGGVRDRSWGCSKGSGRGRSLRYDFSTSPPTLPTVAHTHVPTVHSRTFPTLPILSASQRDQPGSETRWENGSEVGEHERHE